MLAIAASLSEQGIAIETVLSFIFGGTGVSILNLSLLNKLFKRQLLLVYAGTVVTIGVVVGVVFNVFLVYRFRRFLILFPAKETIFGGCYTIVLIPVLRLPNLLNTNLTTLTSPWLSASTKIKS